MSLGSRVERLEAHVAADATLRGEAERVAEVATELGIPLAEMYRRLEDMRTRWRAVLRRCPPVPVAGGQVDIEPPLRAFAAELGIDADRLLRAAERIVAAG